MSTQVRRLEELEIAEADAFDRAGIDLLASCQGLLKNLSIVCLPEGRGLARLVNLLQWDVGQQREYLDGDIVAADQVVHFALHQIWDKKIGSAHPHTMLFAECMASASDLYLLGRLSQAGEETDFLMDTLESFGSYYEMYGTEEQLEELVTRIVEAPFETMIEAAAYLYHLGCRLLEPSTDMGALLEFQDHLMYPLAHHYNISNWILTIRNRLPQNPAPLDPAEVMDHLPRTEKDWLQLF